MNLNRGLRKLPAVPNLSSLARQRPISDQLTQAPPVNPYERAFNKFKQVNFFPQEVTDLLVLGGEFAWDVVFGNEAVHVTQHANGVRRELLTDKDAMIVAKAMYFATKEFPFAQVENLVEYDFVTAGIHLFWHRIFAVFGHFTIPDTISHKFASSVASCFGWWMKKSVPSGRFREIFPHTPSGKGAMRLWDLICNGGRGVKNLPMIGKVYTPTFYTQQTLINPIDIVLSAYPISQTFMLMARFQGIMRENDPTWAPQFCGGVELANDLELTEVCGYERAVANENRSNDIKSYNDWKSKNPTRN